MTLTERIAAYRATVEEWLRGLFHGMFTHPAYEKIEAVNSRRLLQL